jgi:hypothetical protein
MCGQAHRSSKVTVLEMALCAACINSWQRTRGRACVGEGAALLSLEESKCWLERVTWKSRTPEHKAQGGVSSGWSQGTQAASTTSCRHSGFVFSRFLYVI